MCDDKLLLCVFCECKCGEHIEPTLVFTVNEYTEPTPVVIISYRIYGAKLLLRNDANGKKYLYDILDIKKENSSNLPASWLSKNRNNISSSLKTTVPQKCNNCQYQFYAE